MDDSELTEQLSDIHDRYADPTYTDGHSETGFLSLNPRISDRQLQCFEKMLELIFRWAKANTPCGHDDCMAKALFKSGLGDIVPATSVLALIRELALHRQLDNLQLLETITDNDNDTESETDN